MKVLTPVVLSLGAARAVCAQTNSNFYLKTDIGMAIESDIRFQFRGFGYDLPVDPGVRVDVGSGYRLTDWLAAEFETGVVYAKLNLPGDLHRDLYQVPVMGNLVLSDPHSKWKPYLGGGAGIVEVLLNPYVGDSLGLNQHTVFGYQLMTGFRYLFTQHVDLGAEYKFLYVSKFTVEGAPSPDVVMGPGLV